MAKRLNNRDTHQNISLSHTQSFILCTAFLYSLAIVAFILLFCTAFYRIENKIECVRIFPEYHCVALVKCFGVPKKISTNRRWCYCYCCGIDAIEIWTIISIHCYRFHLPISIWMLFFFYLFAVFVLLWYFPSVTFRNGREPVLFCCFYFFALWKEHHTQNIGIL